LDRRQTIPKKIRYVLEYLLFRCLLFAIQNITENLLYRLGQFLGTVIYYCSPKRRRIARINLDIAFGTSKSSKEKNRIAKQSMIYMVVHAMQCLWVTRNTEERVRQLFPIEPEKLEYLHEILKRNKGVFFLMAHYGNWEVLGIYLGYSHYCKLCSIARKFDNPYLEDFIMRLRTISGSRIFHKEESPLKMVRAVKQNSCVAVMMDQNGGIGGLFVDFFGKKAATPRSLALLSRSTGAAVIPLIPYPLENGKYKAIFLPELKLEKTDNKDQDIFRWTEEYQKVLEKVIQDRPEPWMWIHRRWKSRPKGEGRIPIY
jgi:KDO2-lipid IV(A) lauroyltransferase